MSEVSAGWINDEEDHHLSGDLVGRAYRSEHAKDLTDRQ
jgi:hypothetical protein